MEQGLRSYYLADDSSIQPATHHLLHVGKIQPPIQPIIEDIADQESNEAFPESVDDPSSPILDLKTAERIFRGF